jgi:hypothetical protein
MTLEFSAISPVCVFVSEKRLAYSPQVERSGKWQWSSTPKKISIKLIA